jgi:hypothetical protein
MANYTDIKTIKLVRGGSIVGDNKVGSTVLPDTDTDAYISYGGSDDLWGTTLTPSDVNASTFGVVVNFEGTNSEVTSYETEYLKLTNFGASVPSGATIDGVEVRMDAYEKFYGGDTQTDANVDHIQIKVYYTESTGTPVIGEKYPLPAFRYSSGGEGGGLPFLP